MGTRYDEVNVRCPFYVGRYGTDIKCEGINSSSRTILRFTGNSRAEDHKRRFCDLDYKNCLVCRMLEGKYERGK